MIEQHSALMRGNWNPLGPWANIWLAHPSQTLYERGTILVIDHDITVRNLLTSLLPGHGYHVVATATAEEAEDARQLITPAPFDLVITDIHLHNDAQAWEGYVLYHCWTIQQPDLPFLFLSDKPCVQVLSILRSPDVRFLAKPFIQKALLDSVAALIKA